MNKEEAELILKDIENAQYRSERLQIIIDLFGGE
jgi:hypothetical protein